MTFAKADKTGYICTVCATKHDIGSALMSQKLGILFVDCKFCHSRFSVANGVVMQTRRGFVRKRQPPKEK